MDWKENALALIKENAIAFVLGVIGLLCLGYGLFSLSRPASTDSPAEFQTEPQSSEAVKQITPIAKKITIDIEGAVEKPGVYTVATEDRIQDALIAAGGLAENADRQWTAQNLNLAAPLTDSAKIYIPAVGEQYTGSSGSSGDSSGTLGASSKLVNINQASDSDLDALPGIGAVTAQKIISNRPYQSVQDLLTKKVVGQSEFTKIKDSVAVY